ncbi:MAG: hypothetical protein GY927_06520 [bacterium]|nr:hypothetical protein [bacterium]
MSLARKQIMGNISVALAHREKADEHSIDQEAVKLLTSFEPELPGLSIADVVEAFYTRTSGPKVGASITRISSMEELIDTVAGVLSEKGLVNKIALQPDRALVDLDWGQSGFQLGKEVDDGVVVGIARWGIAETGSLVFHSASDMPVLFNFLPSFHIVAVRASTIVPYLESYANAANIAGDPTPRNVCLVTGASGTTDIEGVLVTGAHGPRELHIILIDDTNQIVGTYDEN